MAGWSERSAADSRFSDYATRGRHIRELYALVHSMTPEKTTEEWLDLLMPLRIPVVKMNRLEDLMDDPHLDAVGLFQTYSHPEVGDYVAMRRPVKFSATPGDIRRHPPRLGEHTEELMAEAEAILAARKSE